MATSLIADVTLNQMDSYNYFITIDEDNELQVYKEINEQTLLMNILEQEDEEELSWDNDDSDIKE